MPELLPDGPIDTLGCLEAALALPERLRDAAAAAPVADLPGAADVDAVVVAAPGAVAGAAEVVAALAAPVAPVPVVAHGEGVLPAFVSPRTLVVVASVDDDPVALSLAEQATALGGACVAVAPASSRLADAAALRDPVTWSGAVPRLATGPLAVHGLRLLEQLGVLAEVDAMVSAAASQLERRRDELGDDGGAAARLARRIGRTLPVIYGADAVGGVAARAWKREINLGAKVAAFANAMPSLGWDEVAGWGQHGDMTRQVFTLVTLRHDHEADGTGDRFAVVEDLLDEVVHERYEVAAAGDGALPQLLDLSFQGTLTAWYLAQELEIDPGPTGAVSAVWSQP